AALDRLSGTRIKTNLKANGEEIREGFGLIDSWRIVRHESGRMSVVRVNLSDWLYSAVLGAEVLTLNREYFRLRKPTERRLYELGRKHCGAQSEWSISLALLAKKCGSTANLKEFRSSIAKIVRDDQLHQHMPDYALSLERPGVLTYRRRSQASSEGPVAGFFRIQLEPKTIEAARAIAAGYDPYLIEAEWREWMRHGMQEAPRNPEAAFLGFCRKWVERRGAAA
ncbi:MAG: replication initiator protein A, partial [Myxococcota bacterium]